jgi:nucleoid-associated protein EbfC
LKNLGQMLQQAQEMQAKMEEMQLALEAMEVEGVAGGGLVRVTLNGKGELKSLDIDPSLFSSEDKEVVEDLIVAAHGEAKAKAEQKIKDEMAQMTGGLDLPPGMKLPF